MKYGQEHLLQHWSDLSADQQAALYDDIREFDLQEVTEYFKKTVAVLEHEGEKLDNRYTMLILARIYIFFLLFNVTKVTFSNKILNYSFCPLVWFRVFWSEIQYLVADPVISYK